MKKIFLLLLILNSITALPQDQVKERFKVVKSYDRAEMEKNIDYLRNEYGQNKKIPKEFELAILVALSHYPELKNEKIRFVLKPTYIPLTSKPDIIRIFNRPANKHYVIVISNDSRWYMENILLKNLSFNAQIGVIGHELGHTAFYLGKDPWELASAGLDYISPRRRALFEKDTDRRAIRHGLGWQLHEFASYVRNLPDMKYHKSWVDEFYLNPDLIMNYMINYPEYELKIPNGKN